jgi:hypothetical protein
MDGNNTEEAKQRETSRRHLFQFRVTSASAGGGNWRAMDWAYEQTGLTAAEKGVLMCFASHADKDGYSWPGVDHIASTWSLDRKTVRRAIQALLVRHSLRPTKKRRGTTGQVKVYRLPKSTYESGGKCPPFKTTKAGRKSPISVPQAGAKSPRTDNDDDKTSSSELMTGVPQYFQLGKLPRHQKKFLLKVIINKASQRVIIPSGRNTSNGAPTRKANPSRTVVTAAIVITMASRPMTGFGNGCSARNRIGATRCGDRTTATAST